MHNERQLSDTILKSNAVFECSLQLNSPKQNKTFFAFVNVRHLRLYCYKTIDAHIVLIDQFVTLPLLEIISSRFSKSPVCHINHKKLKQPIS